MTVNYHPSTELLTAYAAGSIPLSQALCLAAHIEMCDSCKQNYKRLRGLGAFMFGQGSEQEHAASRETNAHKNLRQQVFAQIEQDKAVESTQEKAPALLQSQLQEDHLGKDHLGKGRLSSRRNKADAGVKTQTRIPKCLQQFIPTSYEDLPWQRVSPSIKQVNLCSDANGAQVALLKIKPGGSSGHHTHMGDEYTMVLKGAFSDETGIFQQGDFIVRDKKHRHRPIATKDSECICLTVVEAPIQFTGYFSRWLNPLLRLIHPSYAMQNQ
ncbi:Anti-sigma-E factor ChrR [Thalassocella blandensis]|nr:Anti-sigma-E factor ChrR [Thalassocella blandensis]